MKDAQAAWLREMWRQRDNPPCAHVLRCIERGFAGVPTGFLVCASCGCRFPRPPQE